MSRAVSRKEVGLKNSRASLTKNRPTHKMLPRLVCRILGIGRKAFTDMIKTCKVFLIVLVKPARERDSGLLKMLPCPFMTYLPDLV